MKNHVSDHEYQGLRMDVPNTDGKMKVFQANGED